MLLYTHVLNHIMSLYHALIRTHHITSRKKVHNLKTACKNLDVSCLLCSGGPPGIMYVEGSEEGVRDWVATVQVRLDNLYCNYID